MLAQNFKTPAELGISDAEYSALQAVLRMFEREEVVHSSGVDDYQGACFNMGSTWSRSDCGTLGCIGGYVATVLGVSPDKYIYQYQNFGRLTQLYFPRNKNGCLIDELISVTPAQAALAIRSLLTTGEPRWHEALAG